MDNYSYSSGYPDSVQSSPRCETPSSFFDDHPVSSPKIIKFMVSYGGKIQLRSHDNHLSYVAGDTKILSVDRNIKFSLFLSKLSALCDAHNICFKYQLPGEDLDALISVTNDEDLEQLMLEYDRLHGGAAKPARLRLFLFPVNPSISSAFSSADSKSERQWFLDALNSVPGRNDAPSPAATPTATAAPSTSDFLFGFDNHHAPPAKVQESKPAQPVEPVEIQRQMQNLGGGYYEQQSAEPVNIPAGYWQETQVSGGYAPAVGREQQQYYVLPTSAGVQQTTMMRPVTGQGGQGYYGMQRVVYNQNAVPQQQQSFQQQPQNNNVGGYMVGPGEQMVGYDGAGRRVYYTAGEGVVQQQFQVGDGRQGGGALNQTRG